MVVMRGKGEQATSGHFPMTTVTVPILRVMAELRQVRRKECEVVEAFHNRRVAVKLSINISPQYSVSRAEKHKRKVQHDKYRPLLERHSARPGFAHRYRNTIRWA